VAWEDFTNALDYAVINVNEAKVASFCSVPDIGESGVPKVWAQHWRTGNPGLEGGEALFGDGGEL
jgi:hypothetical protein